MGDTDITLPGMPMPNFNPLAALTGNIEGMVKDAIREVVREEIAKAMIDVNILVERMNNLFDAGKESKNVILKALFKDLDKDRD